MGISQICNICSHLQNAARARLGLTSVPNYKYNLMLVLALHRAGFISSVTRGGPHPPSTEQLLATAAAGDPDPVTTANVATRRIWVGLKYWRDEPVMRNLVSVSRPKRLINANLPALKKLVNGFPSGSIKGLNMGESLFLSTHLGVLEAREAIAKQTGGLVLARVS